MSDALAGSGWTEREIDLTVADYFDMLALELAGQPFIKAQRNAALQELTGRSRGSIEFKHQNISAVLYRLGMPWVLGYKPMANFQRTLVDGVQRFIEARPALSSFEPIPRPLESIARKFDPAARDARNRTLGRQGEERIFFSEQSALRAAGRDDLARKVRWVSQEDGDGAGFDIRSWDTRGAERLIEVKTTTGHKTTPFLLSVNERAFSEERPDVFKLVRLYDFARAPRAFELTPPLDAADGGELARGVLKSKL